MLDATVIVVGGGPGGSTVAKKCAEHGLETILLRNVGRKGNLASIVEHPLGRKNING